VIYYNKCKVIYYTIKDGGVCIGILTTCMSHVFEPCLAMFQKESAIKKSYLYRVKISSNNPNACKFDLYIVLYEN